MTAKLNVNIDHVATIREARKTIEPSIVTAAVICEQAGANGITVHQGRLFVGECRDGGRLMELPLDGSQPWVLLDNLPSPDVLAREIVEDLAAALQEFESVATALEEQLGQSR